ncbi:MAG: PHB depolymerase family esterase [Bacteriovorax sp.]|nr:PHB depolymerase family esterase [Bacteriovorax sp.]
MKTQFAMLMSSLFLSLTFNVVHATDFETGSYQGMLGARNFKVYVPAGLEKGKKAPVVMMIHGCDQDAENFAAGTRIVKWADKEKFIVLLPEQNKDYNPYRCWNWVLPVNNSKFGETQVLIDMLDQVLKKYNGDSGKVYAAGMSSGASMVNILGNCYPERFKALASHDGTQFYATQTGMDFADVVLYGASVPAPAAAEAGYACSAYTTNRPKKMPIIIFHGMNSPLMSPAHAYQVENEFKIFNDLLDNGTRDTSYFGSKDVVFYPGNNTYGYNKYTLINKQKEVLIERYMINDLAHSWSGGDPKYPYNDAKGPDATALVIDFFKRYGL